MRRSKWLIGILSTAFLLLLLSPFSLGQALKKEEDAVVQGAVRKGIDFLLRTQHKNGSWGESSAGRGYEILAAVPGSHRAFRVATSGLCVLALLNCGVKEKAIDEALKKGLDFLIKKGRVRRASGMEIYSVWALGYSLRALSEAILAGVCPDRKEEMKRVGGEIVKGLEIVQVPDGGWGYFDFDVRAYRPAGTSMSFTTATEVISLYAAERAGIKVPRKMLRKALLSLHRARLVGGSYLYGWYLRYAMGMGINKIKGSTCRTSCCHLAQYFYNDRVSKADLRKGIVDLIEQNRFVDVARKRPVPHETWYSNSGYFFLYGHYYATMALQQLDKKDQDRLWPDLRRIILSLQQPDGAWWDYPLYGYHKPYGTAYALLTLCWEHYGKEVYVKEKR